jgi:hypothetical protein
MFLKLAQLNLIFSINIHNKLVLLNDIISCSIVVIGSLVLIGNIFWDNVCQWLAAGWWFVFSGFSRFGSTNKTERHDVTPNNADSGAKHNNPNP